ncbi:MAG: S8 family serine peptidase [Phycisphaerae bacterium]
MLSAITAVLGATSVHAQPAVRSPGASSGLFFRTGRVDTRFQSDSRAAGAVSFPQRSIVQLQGPMNSARQAVLEGLGVSTNQYVPRNAYVSELTADQLDALSAISWVKWVGPYLPQWKLDPQLIQRRDTQTHEASRRVIISLFDGELAGPVVAGLTGMGAALLHVNNEGSRLDAFVPADRVPEVARFPAVRFVEAFPTVELRNDTNRWIVQSNASSVTPVWDQGLHGEGQICGLIDRAVDVNHCSFIDSVAPGPGHRKIIHYYTSLGQFAHGTHVAGTLAGDHTNFGVADSNDGLAFAAQFAFTGLGAISSSTPSTTLYDRLADHHSIDGARVHSNSWGSLDGSYNVWSVDADRFSYDFEESLVVFAIANSGTVLSPENGKNVLAVAASDDVPGQDNHAWGATGPTFDGRRKPEVLAPGNATVSSQAKTVCNFIADSGTSMACPAVAAAGTLVRQYFVDGFYPSGFAQPADTLIPSGALLRAMLINSAADMTGVAGYPSDLEGWGRVTLDQVLYFAGDNRNLSLDDVRNIDGLVTGEEALYYVQVADPLQTLRLTLVWTEPPAAEGTAFAPINDLDLVVTAPNGDVFAGNDFDTALGESRSGGIADALNNVEQVHLLVPATGLYEVRVVGSAVNLGTQGYALVATGGLGPAGPAPILLSAASCSTHAAAGEFCVDLLAGPSAIVEPRLPGVTKVLVAASADLDPASVTTANVQVSCATTGPYTGAISTTMQAANALAIAFDPRLADEDCCQISLNGMLTVDGFPLLATVQVRTLRGDVDQDGQVTTGDASQVRFFFNQPVDASSFIFDVDGSGAITTGDFSQVRPFFNKTAPACP